MGAVLAEIADNDEIPRVVSTQRAVARAIGVSDMTVSQWIRTDPTFPRTITADGRAMYDIPKIVSWMAKRKGKRQRGRPSGGPIKAPAPGSDASQFVESSPDDRMTRSMVETETLVDRQLRAKTEKEEALAKINAIKAGELEGRFVSREEFEQAVGGIAALFRKLIIEIPDRVRADHGEEIAEIVEGHLDRVWLELDQLRNEQLEQQAAQEEPEADAAD